MFDQYGTVVDMQSGLTAVAAPFLKSKCWPGNPNSFVTWWRRTHFENSMIDALLHKEHTPYREIGHRSVAHVLERAGIDFTMDEVHYLVGEIEKLRPFPEVPAALARLQTRYKLVVLSNGDPDMLEAARPYHARGTGHRSTVWRFRGAGRWHRARCRPGGRGAGGGCQDRCKPCGQRPEDPCRAQALALRGRDRRSLRAALIAWPAWPPGRGLRDPPHTSFRVTFGRCVGS